MKTKVGSVVLGVAVFVIFGLPILGIGQPLFSPPESPWSVVGLLFVVLSVAVVFVFGVGGTTAPPEE